MLYSSRVTESHRYIFDCITTRPKRVVQRIECRYDDDNDDLWHSYTFGLRQGSLRLILKKQPWQSLLQFYRLLRDPRTAEADRRSIVFDQKDALERQMYNILRPHRRVALRRFRDDGMLLPLELCRAFRRTSHGQTRESNACLHSRIELTERDSISFDEDSLWMQQDYLDPLFSWPREDVEEFLRAHPDINCPKNDIYGQLYFFLQHMLSTVHSRLRNKLSRSSYPECISEN